MAKSTPATLALEKAGVAFKLHEYDYDPNAARIGMQAAEALGIEPARLLKTRDPEWRSAGEGEGAFAAGGSATPSKWKKAIDCGLPSSHSVKSAGASPVTGLPFLSSTVTSTSTSLLPARNNGPGCWQHRTPAASRPQMAMVVPECNIWPDCITRQDGSEASLTLPDWMN